MNVIAGTVDASMGYAEGSPGRRLHRPLAGLAATRICQEVRDIVHEADPEVEETIKRTVQPYFVLAGQRHRAARGEGPHHGVPLRRRPRARSGGIITGGQGNETGRFIAIRENEPINRPAMLALFRAIIANNRAGGWRKIRAGALARGVASRRIDLLP